VRIARLAETVEVLRGLFGNAPFSYDGEHYRITELDGLPKPIQRPHPPIAIGGGRQRVLELAGRCADIVSVSPRLAKGVAASAAAVTDMSPDWVAQKVAWARAGAVAAGRDPDALELQMTISDLRLSDGGSELRSTSSLATAASEETLRTSPMVLHGSVDECVDKLIETRERYGISYLHLGSNVDAAAPIVARLAGM
jgi:alkanesulfonate monooxygenase SsuD/methylene tetrahydromethanopterin reductase-like flavin-dependent oxidoreductase (luciferase family)